MKLWLISQEDNRFDAFRSAVVAAETREEAILTHPSSGRMRGEFQDWCWADSPESVKCSYLGEAAGWVPEGPVCADFNA